MEQINKNSKKGRILKGKVISKSGDKTVVVLVDRYKKHPKYNKRYKISKKYKVHDQENKYKAGDEISIQECSPISKDKHWKVL